MDLVETVISLVPVPYLSTIVNIATTIYDAYNTRNENKGAIKELREKVGLLVTTLNTKCQGMDSPPPQATQQFKALESLLLEIKEWIDRHDKKSFVKQIALSGKTKEQISYFETKLTDFVGIFQLAIQSWHPDSAILAFQGDMRQMNMELLKAVNKQSQDIHKVMDNLGIVETNMIESMDHLQQILKNSLTKESKDIRDDVKQELETQINKLVQMLQTKTGSGSREECKWNIITEEELCCWSKDPIGMGSFGVVQKARWHTTVVAVKRAHEEVRGKQVIDTIRDEIEKWSRVRHPNVAEMLGACIQTDKPFLVTRYYRHGNLHSYINSHPKLPIIQRIKWFYDIASGLEHIHRVGIIHGDLKGDNVLLDDTYAAIITDFGLSQLKRTCSSNSSHNETVAKKMTEAIRWIAPERYARKFKLAPSYDVFAFGMTCYEVLTGRVPYFDESNEQVVKEKIREGILPERPDNIEDPVWKMLTKCLIKEPENRAPLSQTMSRLEDMFSSFAGSKDLLGPGQPSHESLNKSKSSLHDSGYTEKGSNADLSRKMRELEVGIIEQNDDYDMGMQFFEMGQYQNAVSYFEEAVKHSHTQSEYQLGYIYDHGLDVEQDYKKAMLYYVRASRKQHYGSMAAIGFLYLYGRGLQNKEPKQALSWFNRSLKGNSVLGKIGLGVLHETGQELPKDLDKAMRYYMESQDHPLAQYLIGKLFERGLGVDRDYEKAMDWYLKASDKSLEAQTAIGYLYFRGQGVPQDYYKAMDYFMAAAKMGDSQAQAAAGHMYEHGFGVPMDYQKAMEWYQRAVSRGNACAEDAIGGLYLKGKGVPKDDAKAAIWFMKAAHRNDPLGQLHLAEMQLTGKGITKDLKQAKIWCEKAAKQDLQAAQELLKTIQ